MIARRTDAQREELRALREKAQELLREHPAFERGREAAMLDLLAELENDLAQLRSDQARGIGTTPVLYASLIVERLRRRLGRPA